MGTRHLTAVVKNGDFKVAQYGQWDGCPEGQGATILDFLSNVNLSHFESQLEKCRFLAEEECERRYKARDLPESGWMDDKRAAIYNDEFPYFTRDHGADILKLIDESNDNPIDLRDSHTFAGDSLFCEYAYVLDMDKEVLEVYRGFNTSGAAEGRFKDLECPDNHRRDNKYDPVTLIAQYSFYELPSVEQLCADVDPDDEVGD